MRAAHRKTIAKTIAAAAGVILFYVGHGLAAEPADILNKGSQNPALIRAQLDLARLAARQTLDRLRTAPSTETPATLDETIHTCYRYISLGQVGVRGRLLAWKKKIGVDDPLLGMAATTLDSAATHIRNARHLAQSFSPERHDVIERIILRLEDTITAVEQVIDLI